MDGLIQALNAVDQQLLLFLNGLHTGFFDFFMYWMSDRFIWFPFYLFLIILLVVKYKKHSILLLVLLGATIAAADQSSVFIKNLVMRPRPCHNEDIRMMVHLVKDHCGGPYGFVSSHSTNVFALAAFLIPFFRDRRWFKPLILVWAAVIAYSRVYLGVHYPGDILFGGLLGAALGYAISRVFFVVYPEEKHHGKQ